MTGVRFLLFQRIHSFCMDGVDNGRLLKDVRYDLLQAFLLHLPILQTGPPAEWRYVRLDVHWFSSSEANIDNGPVILTEL